MRPSGVGWAAGALGSGLWAGRLWKGHCQAETAGPQGDEGSGPLGVELSGHPGTVPLMGPLAEAFLLQCPPDPRLGRPTGGCPRGCVFVAERAVTGAYGAEMGAR